MSENRDAVKRGNQVKSPEPRGTSKLTKLSALDAPSSPTTLIISIEILKIHSIPAPRIPIRQKIGSTPGALLHSAWGLPVQRKGDGHEDAIPPDVALERGHGARVGAGQRLPNVGA